MRSSTRMPRLVREAAASSERRTRSNADRHDHEAALKDASVGQFDGLHLAPPRMARVFAPSSTPTPFALIASASRAAPSASSCRSIRRSARCTSSPPRRVAPGRGRPRSRAARRRSPPQAAARRQNARKRRYRRVSRKVATPLRPLPGTESVMGSEPVASTRMSKGMLRPFCSRTQRAPLSRTCTTWPVMRSMSCAAYHCLQRSNTSTAAASPASKADSSTRL